MVYFPTFTIKNNQMLVNITYMDPMGMGAYWKIISLPSRSNFCPKEYDSVAIHVWEAKGLRDGVAPHEGIFIRFSQ